MLYLLVFVIGLAVGGGAVILWNKDKIFLKADAIKDVTKTVNKL